jgi:ABC-type iron transport system FetAB permease component
LLFAPKLIHFIRKYILKLKHESELLLFIIIYTTNYILIMLNELLPQYDQHFFFIMKQVFALPECNLIKNVGFAFSNLYYMLTNLSYHSNVNFSHVYF